MHGADGFEMKFTHRSSWKGNIYRLGRLIEVVPVTWTKGWTKKADGTVHLEVWFRDKIELQARALDPSPFHVALAVAKDYGVLPHSFRSYQGLFEVRATGQLLSDLSLETCVLTRVIA